MVRCTIARDDFFVAWMILQMQQLNILSAGSLFVELWITEQNCALLQGKGIRILVHK